MKPVKVLRLVIFIIPFLCLIPAFTSLSRKPISLFPWEQRVFHADAYADGDDASGSGIPGSTVDQYETNPDSITLRYTLRAAEEYPYAGIYFSMVAGGAFANLTGYDHMTITASADPPNVYQIKITTFITGYSDTGNSNTFCPIEKTIRLDNTMREYTIPLSQFELLSWWFEDAKLQTSDYNPRDLLANVYQINIQQTKRLKPGAEESAGVTIRGISIRTSHALPFAISGAGFLASFTAAILLFFRIKKTGNVRIAPVPLDSYSDIDTRRLADFIETNYTNPELSAAMLYRETGISRRRIASLLNRKYKLPFKRLLNTMRLNEAARLLVETDRNITDIALALGFGSPSYFFQVFRGAYHVSPSDYRKRHVR